MSEDEVYLERYTMNHAYFGGIGGDIASVTITAEAWRDMGRPGTLYVSAVSGGVE